MRFDADIISFGVDDDAAGKLEFNGSARIIAMGKLRDVDSSSRLIDFEVTVQDFGVSPTLDSFSIVIKLNPVVVRSGKLVRGDIQVHRAY
jgi:hypothetical protein